MTALLEVRDLHVHYGNVAALRGVNFEVNSGEVVALIGANGAGKSTTLRALSGVSELGKSVKGAVTFDGARIEKKHAHHIARRGIVHVPEGRRVFPGLTVRDNLLLGGYRRKRDSKAVLAAVDEMLERFPALQARRDGYAGLMSGGEQQMLAIARALVAAPRVLLLDEPSLGLAPLMVEQVFDTIAELARDGMTILLVEQLATKALEVSGRAYVLETGLIVADGPVDELGNDARIRSAYLGLPA
jgi:branched-chain amino acid transport system ATP-binding protein